MKARVFVTLKEGVLDPQGEAVRQALGSLGFDGVNGVRQGKVIDLDLDEGATESDVASMCEKLGWSGEHPRVKPPQIPGHEYCGEVVQAGPNAEYGVGDKLIAPFILACGTCPNCRSNHVAHAGGWAWLPCDNCLVGVDGTRGGKTGRMAGCSRHRWDWSVGDAAGQSARGAGRCC